jgi:hypothetical protein
VVVHGKSFSFSRVQGDARRGKIENENENENEYEKDETQDGKCVTA